MNIKLTALFLFAFFGSYAQSVELIVDEMTDNQYLVVVDKHITYDGESRSDGVVWDMSFRKKGDSWKISGVSLKVYGLSCLENTTVIVLFEDGDKITLQQWNKFNCKENVWTNQTASELEKLRTKKIKKVRVTNGRSYESYEWDVTDDPLSEYYIEIIKQFDEGVEKGEFPIYVEE